MRKLLKTLALTASLTFTPFAFADEYVNNDILISAKEAIKLIGKENVMFVSGDNADVFKLGHIKGSVEMYAHGLHRSDITGEMHCAPLYRCLDDAEIYIGSKGISNDTMIIAYDDFKGPNATGVYSFFTSFGHKNIKILNGGRNAIMEIDPQQIKFDALKDKLRDERVAARNYSKELREAKSDTQKASIASKIEASNSLQEKYKDEMKALEDTLIVVKGEEVVTPKVYKINKDDIDLTYIARTDEVRHAMEDILKNGKDSKYVIIDSRAMTEIIGERKMDNVARGGHIPGSTFMEWNKISDVENKKSFKSAKDLKEVYAKYGISKDKTIYAYCMVGAGRGSEHITALKLLGYDNIKVYTGSWDVWGNSMNLPLKR